MESETLKFGLKPEVIKQINEVFASFPEVGQVILYGSRAKGTFRRGSDIDLCLEGDNLSLPTLLKIDTALDDLLLPYKIDLSIRDHIDNIELLSHIERAAPRFYRRNKE
ncbi:nucleotidyltransferase domain-containing protein [Pseudoduganella sp. FT25W]|jgi:predicted nucleotidyltransferase|uniref:Nucleotidyltransferase domain-containing protein n=1 Tax=Duganella alba TaxID=2666081 RepID=A0A6L5QE75_9BURK|nr:nucleotidyltransferase domain-containing protein [Duganella alba]MRX07411.1 nucleotidyltransferase domain-containing protein [Duganella alba]MRX19714.1 nucleotidyltransferase domain-containing protein [Duganella alba]